MITIVFNLLFLKLVLSIPFSTMIPASKVTLYQSYIKNEEKHNNFKNIGGLFLQELPCATCGGFP